MFNNLISETGVFQGSYGGDIKFQLLKYMIHLALRLVSNANYDKLVKIAPLSITHLIK